MSQSQYIALRVASHYHGLGRKPKCIVREAWVDMTGLEFLSESWKRRLFTNRMMEQLSNCKSDEARRILIRARRREI
jgi:hypothetical protein